MRNLSFSTKYPSYHTKAGEETFFIEKIWTGLGAKRIQDVHSYIDDKYVDNLEIQFARYLLMNFDSKEHTVRENENWKPGDLFKPKVWSGRPYWSKPLQFADPIEVKSTYKFEKGLKGVYKLNGKTLSPRTLEEIAANDGLAIEDFKIWFSKEPIFVGQIICWTDLKY